MALPTVILLILFNYVPMAGLVVAFKDFNYADGLFKSPWNGVQNFRYLFMVGDTAWRLTRNTVGYYLIFTVLGTIGNVAIAIGINEMIYKRTAKYFQTAMILPTFISYIAITFIVEAFLKTDTGIVNRFLENIGIGGIALKSPFVMQTLSDVLDMPIKVCRTDQACALGAAMFAATAAGLYPTVEAAQAAMNSGYAAEYRPNANNAVKYQKIYEKYCNLGAFTEKELFA